MDKLSNGLAKLAEEDPTFTVKTDFITQSIPSTNIFKAYTCTNITSTDYFNRVLFVGVHLVRVYSGKIEAGSYIYNSRSGKKERVSRLFQMHSRNISPSKHHQILLLFQASYLSTR